MLFNQIEYFIFLPIVFLLYHLVPIKLKRFVLLCASIIFILCQNAMSLFVLAWVAMISYVGAYKISDVCGGKRKKLMILYEILLVGTLFIFKYMPLVKSGEILAVVPIGISFYILRAMGYIVDVYKGEKIERNIFDHLIFISFFPLLVAGPIEKGERLRNALHEEYVYNSRNTFEGINYFIKGLFLKIVIADRIAVIVDNVYSSFYEYGGGICLFAILLYSVQIYADFEGYSLMAVGSAKMLGIDVMVNFRQPYLACSIRDFWRRWHISLSEWFRDYVYIPLGGNRKGIIRKEINISIVFILSGIWHGTSLNFAIWGCMHGLYQVFEDLGSKNIKRMKSNKLTSILKIFLTFTFITIAWVFFRMNDLHDAIGIIGHSVSSFDLNEFVDGSLFELGWGRLQILGLFAAIVFKLVYDFIIDRKTIITNQSKIKKIHVIMNYILILWIVVALVQLCGIQQEATFIYANF